MSLRLLSVSRGLRRAPLEVAADVSVVVRGDAQASSLAAELEASGSGRLALLDAMLRRTGPLLALDTHLFLAVNGGTHPRPLDTLACTLSLVGNGGWIWVAGVCGAYLLRVPGSERAVRELVPGLIGVTLTVESVVKAFFRRRRPFVPLDGAIVVGRKPVNWSFPSGHTASSFAGAWLLSSIWPRRAPLFFTLASCVGLSRIYVGAHYPADVLSGVVLGVSLAELFRCLQRLSVGLNPASAVRVVPGPPVPEAPNVRCMLTAPPRSAQ